VPFVRRDPSEAGVFCIRGPFRRDELSPAGDGRRLSGRDVPDPRALRTKLISTKAYYQIGGRTPSFARDPWSRQYGRDRRLGFPRTANPLSGQTSLLLGSIPRPVSRDSD
jgi:hypothetical protein